MGHDSSDKLLRKLGYKEGGIEAIAKWKKTEISNMKE